MFFLLTTLYCREHGNFLIAVQLVVTPATAARTYGEAGFNLCRRSAAWPRFSLKREKTLSVNAPD